jgi:hypothetical protein
MWGILVLTLNDRILSVLFLVFPGGLFGESMSLCNPSQGFICVSTPNMDLVF